MLTIILFTGFTMSNELGEPPFTTTDESLETGPHILTIFASTHGGQIQAIELLFIVPGE